MTNDETPGGEGRKYDLEPRTSKFGEAIIGFARKLPRDPVTTPLISQVVRSGTSIGANYCEADDAVSGKEFKHKIGTCKKEARETKFWLRQIAAAAPEHKTECRQLWQEAKELHLIFAKIWRG
jgi:four helix bundle protein